MSGPLPAVRALPLEALPAAFPFLRFAVRSAQGHPLGRHQGHDAGARHPLAGTGKLVLACAVARLAGRDPDLLGQRLTLSDRHRAGARTGTLRLMSGPLSLTVDDAMALVVGTGDAMCVLGVLEFLRDRGTDVLGEARALVTALGLEGTEITGLETDAGTDAEPDGEAPRGISWGEGVTGESTPADLCALLSALPEPVTGWMGAAFEPAGLASGLPGVGPRTVPHQTVAGAPLLGHPAAGAPGRPRGWASVLGLPGVAVAAFVPAAARHGQSAGSSAHAAVTALEASAALGTLGLSVWQDLRG